MEGYNMNELLLGLLKQFLTKESLKKLANPLVDELFSTLAVKARESENNLDDAVVAALARAAKEIIAAW